MVISDFVDRIRLLFIPEKKPFLRLKSILGFYPHNIRLYRLALMHKSVSYHEQEMEKANKRKSRRANARDKTKMAGEKIKESPHYVNNERLEFLGDAMLGAIVADILYKHYGNKQEGFLTNLRSKIVCRNSLNKVAAELGLDKLIQHTGAITTAHNSFMSGNAFEAFIGAIYLDRGYQYCYRFLEEKVFKYHINIEQVAQQERNFKSALIEWCQKYQYQFAFNQKESRDTTNRSVPVFHSRVLIEGIPCGTGDGYSKKESDQNAAKQALKQLTSKKGQPTELRMAIEQQKRKR